MNKETLVKLMQERDLTYPEFLQQAQKDTVSERWGMGIGEPYSMEPYRMELLGIKPGRMLKKPSKPTRYRYCYSYDKDGRVIRMVEYSEMGGAPENRVWLCGEDFYEYGDKCIIRYVFGNVSCGGEDASLDRIVWANTDGNKIIKTLQLENRSLEYTEECYSYDNDKIIEMHLRWPEGPYPGRDFRVFHESGGVRIMETWNNQEIQIYPEKA